MLKKAVLTLALALVALPGVAMAQQHQHHGAARQHDAAKVAEHHKDFAMQLAELRAELKLTEAQIAKLHALSAKMQEHHKHMGAHAAKDADAEEKLHAELLTVFTKEQLKKVHPMLLKHVSEVCGGDGKDMQCKIEKPAMSRE